MHGAMPVSSRTHRKQWSRREPSLQVGLDLVREGEQHLDAQLVLGELVQGLLKVGDGEHPPQGEHLVGVRGRHVRLDDGPGDDLVGLVAGVSGDPEGSRDQGTVKSSLRAG